MKGLNYIGYFAILLLAFTACRKDLKSPDWDVDLLVPILTSTLSIDDLIEDSIKQVNNDSSISIVYQNEMYSFSLDSLFQLPDTSINYTAKLDKLDLGNIELTYRTSLGDIANKDRDVNGPTGGLYEIIMNAYMVGASAAIDPMEQQEYPDIEINGNDYFHSISLSSGFVDIKIDNDLPVSIDNLVFQLKNLSDGTIIVQDTFPHIPPYTSESSSSDLSGKTIYGDLVGYVKIESQTGSAGQVPIDTSDAMVASITFRDIVIDSATAIFPNQDIINSGEVSKFETDGFQLSKVIARQGQIRIEVYNTVEETLHYTYRIPGALKNGNPFEITGSIPPSVGGTASFTEISEDISGYEIDLRGIGPIELIQGDLNENGIIDVDTVNSIYYEISGRIDSTGNLISLSLNDSLFIHIEFSGIIPEYALGSLGQQFMSEIDTVDFAGMEDWAERDIRFNKAKVSMNISNQFGVASQINIGYLTGINTVTGNTVSLEMNSSLNPITISKPIDPNSVYSDVIPTENGILLNASNSNINDFVSNFPNSLSYAIDYASNPGSATGSGTDFIYMGDKISANLNVEIPLSMVTNKLVLCDTSEITLEREDIENVNYGNLNIFVDNYYPVVASFQLYLLDDQYQTFDSLFVSPGIIDAGLIDSYYDKVIHPKRSKIVISLPRDKLEKLVDSYYVRVVTDFSTMPSGEFIKIFSTYTIKFSITTDFNYHLD